LHPLWWPLFFFLRALAATSLACDFGQGVARRSLEIAGFHVYRAYPPAVVLCVDTNDGWLRWVARLSAFGSWFMAPNFSLWFVTPLAEPASIIYLTRRCAEIFWLFQNEQQNKWEKSEWLNGNAIPVAAAAAKKVFLLSAETLFFHLCTFMHYLFPAEAHFRKNTSHLPRGALSLKRLQKLPCSVL
jgi:hypothetical protein